MTRIDFYHGAADKLAAACHLLQEFHQDGRRVVVYAPDQALAARLDTLLWSQPATGFLPHCRLDSPLVTETPIVIGAELEQTPHHDVLINLDGELPPSFSRFEQLVEIVGNDDADRTPARSRFKFYRDRGYALQAHNLAGDAP